VKYTAKLILYLFLQGISIACYVDAMSLSIMTVACLLGRPER